MVTMTLAPVYDHVPLGLGDWRGNLPDPRWPDPIVFGNVAAQPEHDPKGTALSSCRSCGVRWDGLARCWACAPATGT